MKRKAIHTILALFILIGYSCENQKEHTAPAIHARDSVAMMTTYGVNTMISDSGMMKYRIIAERWEINENVNPARWIFKRGLFMEQFDEKFHTEAYIQADTAYNYHRKKLWHLIGNVRVRTLDGLYFYSEELYWDQNTHELYSNRFSHLITPERELQGAYFRSDERMTHYSVTNTKGSFIQEDIEDKKDDKKEGDSKNTATNADSLPKRNPATPSRRH